MSDEAALRQENSVLQRRLASQRGELARLYADNSALSLLMSRLFKENWDLKKRLEAAPSPLPPSQQESK